MFQKWVAAGGTNNGFALEACLRMRKQVEEVSRDSGCYKNWDAVLQHFNGNVDNAREFARLRESQPKGTSTDRNNPKIKTYLLFDDEQRSWTRKTIEPVLHVLQAMCLLAIGLCVLMFSRCVT